MLDVDLHAMRRLVEGLDCRPLFVTVSGAHLYGFPSADSDVDLRGCHQLPLRDIFGFGFLDDLVARKVCGEKASVGDLDWSFHEARLAELEAQLDRAFQESKLPEDRDRKSISDFLVMLRLGRQ